MSGYDREVLRRPETAHLPSVLDAGEMPKCIAYDRNLNSVAFATDQRIINIKKSVFGDSIKKVESYPYTDLISIKAGKKFLDFPLEIKTEKQESININASKETRFAFAEFVERKIGEEIKRANNLRRKTRDARRKRSMKARRRRNRRARRKRKSRVKAANYATGDSGSTAGPKLLRAHVTGDLTNVLSKGEHVLDIIQGEYDHESGLILSTNKRLVFIAGGRLTGHRMEDVPNDEITSVLYDPSLLPGAITIKSFISTGTIYGVPECRARQFAEGLNARTTTLDEQTETQQRSVSLDAAEGIDIALRKLAKLEEEGILTEREFIAKKRQLLGI
ncbi:MAG: PH domain-containing protein [Bryobacterales bacterium]|nr:PH domain-containing protein [Bryobacterales bacterium]